MRLFQTDTGAFRGKGWDWQPFLPSSLSLLMKNASVIKDSLAKVLSPLPYLEIKAAWGVIRGYGLPLESSLLQSR